MASVNKRPDRPDRPWQARWREYPGGPQRTKQFARKVDAERHLVRVQHDLATGAYIDPTKARTTVAEYYRAWSARQPWRAKTRAAVATSFGVHVLQRFGDHPLGSVRRGDVEAFAATLPLAPSSARLVLQHFSALFEAALADGLVPTNPLRGAKRPKADSPPILPLSADQLEALAAAAPPWFVVAVTLGAGAGLRQAESTGLSVDRVDFLHRHLRVDRQLLSGPDGATSFGPPKTARSYRTVPLADSTLTSIAHHLEHFGTGEHGLVLHEDGRPVHANRFGPLWQQTRRRAGLRLARFHDCRHTFASILLHGGVSVPAAAEYLGHTPAVLLSTYAHLVPADHDRARSAVEAAFAGSAEDQLRTSASSESS